MIDEKDKKEIKEMVERMIKSSSTNIYQKRTGDTPVEAFDLVNKSYLQQHGALSARPTPTSTEIGRMFFNTSSAIANWWTGSVWKDANGNTV